MAIIASMHSSIQFSRISLFFKKWNINLLSNFSRAWRTGDITWMNSVVEILYIRIYHFILLVGFLCPDFLLFKLCRQSLYIHKFYVNDIQFKVSTGHIGEPFITIPYLFVHKFVSHIQASNNKCRFYKVAVLIYSFV